MDRHSVLPVAFAVEGALLLLAFGFGAVTGDPPFARLRFDPAGIAIGTLAGAVLLVVLLPAMRSDWPPFARLAEAVREVVRRYFTDASLLDIAVVSALAGIAEEALFRGVIQTALIEPTGIVGAILLAGALFGLAHAVTVTYAAVATAVGIALGVLFAVTGDLAAPILAHAIYDFLALVWLVRIEAVGSSPGERDVSTPEENTR